MTYIIGTRCDICGTFVTEDYDGQQHTVPDGWGFATAHLPMPGPNCSHIDICPECCERIASRDPTHNQKDGRRARWQTSRRSREVPPSRRPPAK